LDVTSGVTNVTSETTAPDVTCEADVTSVECFGCDIAMSHLIRYLLEYCFRSIRSTTPIASSCSMMRITCRRLTPTRWPIFSWLGQHTPSALAHSPNETRVSRWPAFNPGTPSSANCTCSMLTAAPPDGVYTHVTGGC